MVRKALFGMICILVASTMAMAAKAPPPSCEPIAGAESLLRSGRILLLGEIHGTEQAPAFAASLACHALAAGHGVTVGLELLQEDQARVDAFLRSPGRGGDFEKMWSGFWRQNYQDGRASKAMATLIDDLRKLRQAGHSIEVVLLDRPGPGPSGGRDQAMAKRLIEAHEAHPKQVVLSLTGNVHNRTAIGTPWNASYEPMGYLVMQLLPDADILSLNLSHTGGTAWVCLSGEPCKVQPLGGRGKMDDLGVTLHDEADAAGFHGVYDVGPISASLPAARGKPEPEPAKP